MSVYQHPPTTRRVLLSLVPVICPPEAAALADAIIDHMALTVGQMPPMLQKAFSAGFTTYDLSALPRYRMRAHKLGPADAERYYESWRHGITPVHREFAKLLNQLMSMSCYEQPAMLERIGVRWQPWIEEVKKKRLAVFSDDIKKQESAILAPDPLRPNAQVPGNKRKKEVA
jgi:hypothetical protein